MINLQSVTSEFSVAFSMCFYHIIYVEAKIQDFGSTGAHEAHPARTRMHMGPFGIRKTLLARTWCFQRANGTSNMRTRPSGARTRPSSARARNVFGERAGFLDTAASITT